VHTSLSEPALDPDREARISLCGELRVSISGRPCEAELPGRQGPLLFAYLVLNRRTPVSRDELIEALWDGRPPGAPDATLSSLLTRVRQALGPGVLHGRSYLSLELPAHTKVDVEIAAEAAEKAEAAMQERDIAAGLQHAETALALLDRPLLLGLEAIWIEERHRQLAVLKAELLELLAKGQLARGAAGFSRAELAARELTDLAPYRESGYLLLMEAHARRGNVAEALGVYERLRVLLREDLGLVPTGDVAELHALLLREPARFFRDRRQPSICTSPNHHCSDQAVTFSPVVPGLKALTPLIGRGAVASSFLSFF
jgi:SARP family transcriptional regulator, regulator of embCAB operon